MRTIARTALWALGPALALAAAISLGGCHTYSQCPVVQGASFGRMPPPLPPEPGTPGIAMGQLYVGGTFPGPPPEGDAYIVTGYRPGIRFYVIQYTPNLYRGGDILSREGAQSLKALGIKTIISVDPSGKERALAREFGFRLVEIPFTPVDLTRARLDAFLAAVDANPGPIYVHCFGGDLRAGILLAHYRIHKQGWTFRRAYTEYRRLDANLWDSALLVAVLKANAAN
ncbi:MAG: hypothetical protein NTV86_22105 [Planctomycetota bacterium]|nr:hypothetical protein [Planctomycetota bacterium]